MLQKFQQEGFSASHKHIFTSQTIIIFEPTTNISGSNTKFSINHRQFKQTTNDSGPIFCSTTKRFRPTTNILSLANHGNILTSQTHFGVNYKAFTQQRVHILRPTTLQSFSNNHKHFVLNNNFCYPTPNKFGPPTKYLNQPQSFGHQPQTILGDLQKCKCSTRIFTQPQKKSAKPQAFRGKLGGFSANHKHIFTSQTHFVVNFSFSAQHKHLGV